MGQTLNPIFAMILSCTAVPALAADDASPAPKLFVKHRQDLTPAERAEKASHHACKVAICRASTGQAPPEGKISCDIVKTWHEKEIEEMIGSRISWPWGNAVCQSDLRIDRKVLRDAATRPKTTIRLPNQTVSCRLHRKGGGEPYRMIVNLAPEVRFEDGKAVEAHANWGEVEAPMGLYSLIYSGTGLDNQANMLGSEIVQLVNQFTEKECAELGVKPDAAPRNGAGKPLTPEKDPAPPKNERKVEREGPKRVVAH